MPDHDNEILFTGVLVVRAWGLTRFNETLQAATSAIVAGNLPRLPGVLYEDDPGGGGPGTRETQRKFDFIMDGRGLPGEPQYPTGEADDK